MISVHAIKAATTNATVVKNPKTFWMRTTEECMFALIVCVQLEGMVFAIEFLSYMRRRCMDPNSSVVFEGPLNVYGIDRWRYYRNLDFRV